MGPNFESFEQPGAISGGMERYQKNDFSAKKMFNCLKKVSAPGGAVSERA